MPSSITKFALRIGVDRHVLADLLRTQAIPNVKLSHALYMLDLRRCPAKMQLEELGASGRFLMEAGRPPLPRPASA